MSWKELIAPSTQVWAGVLEYAHERIHDLTTVCISAESTEAQIRAAQAGITELERLIGVPKMIAVEAQLRGAKGSRKEY